MGDSVDRATVALIKATPLCVMFGQLGEKNRDVMRRVGGILARAHPSCVGLCVQVAIFVWHTHIEEFNEGVFTGSSDELFAADRPEAVCWTVVDCV